MNCLNNSDSMKKVCLLPYGPASRLWRNFLKRSANLKRVYVPPHLYKPVFQLSGASVRPCKEDDTVGILWFYLRDHGEDMRKWDGKSTSTLEAQVRELQGKTIEKKGFSEKLAAPISSGQSSRHRNEDSDQD